MRNLFLSFGGVGYLKPAPGTWGSLATLPLAYVLHLIWGPAAIALAAGLLNALGTVAVDQHIRENEDHDPSWVVIDEVVGQLLALMPVSAGAYFTGTNILNLWPGIVAAFLLFRLFDIWKPWLVGKADARGDAKGVMLDDVWAGVFAAIGGLALAAVAHLVLM